MVDSTSHYIMKQHSNYPFMQHHFNQVLRHQFVARHHLITRHQLVLETNTAVQLAHSITTVQLQTHSTIIVQLMWAIMVLVVRNTVSQFIHPVLLVEYLIQSTTHLL